MIFCVEDEQNICELEVYTLQSVGMEAQGCGSGRELFALLEKQVPELIVLDIMLPDEDGVSILRRLRADKRYSNIPVIMATAKGSEFDKVKGLDSGADDYIAKPFGMLEMVARIKAVLRRCAAPRRDEDDEETIRIGRLEVKQMEHKVSVGGSEVVLTLKEYELLRKFCSIRVLSFRATSCLTISGAMNSAVKLAPLMCISVLCARSLVRQAS